MDHKYQEDAFFSDLITCCRENNSKKVRELIREGANINFSGEDGWTPLMIAALHNSGAVVDELLKANVRIDLENKEQRNAEDIALTQGHKNIAARLITASFGSKQALLRERAIHSQQLGDAFLGLTEIIDEYEDKLEDEHRLKRSLKHEIHKYEDLTALLNEKLEEKKNECITLYERVEKKDQKIEELEKQINEFEKQLNSKIKELALTKLQIEQLQLKEKNLQQKVSDLEFSFIRESLKYKTLFSDFENSQSVINSQIEEICKLKSRVISNTNINNEQSNNKTQNLNSSPIECIEMQLLLKSVKGIHLELQNCVKRKDFEWKKNIDSKYFNTSNQYSFFNTSLDETNVNKNNNNNNSNNSNNDNDNVNVNNSKKKKKNNNTNKTTTATANNTTTKSNNDNNNNNNNNNNSNSAEAQSLANLDRSYSILKSCSERKFQVSEVLSEMNNTIDKSIETIKVKFEDSQELFQQSTQKLEEAEIRSQNHHQKIDELINELIELMIKTTLIESARDVAKKEFEKSKRYNYSLQTILANANQTMDKIQEIRNENAKFIREWNEHISKPDLKTWGDREWRGFLELLQLDHWLVHFKSQVLNEINLADVRPVHLMQVTDQKGEKMTFGEAKYICLAIEQLQQTKTIPVMVHDIDLDEKNAHLWTRENVFSYFKKEGVHDISIVVQNSKINGLVLMKMEEHDIEKLQFKRISQINCFLNMLRSLQNFQPPKKKSIEPPLIIICPLSNRIMRDPVVAQDGHIYERTEIENYLKSTQTSPITGKSIGNMLIPCIAVYRLCQDWTKNS